MNLVASPDILILSYRVLWPLQCLVRQTLLLTDMNNQEIKDYIEQVITRHLCSVCSREAVTSIRVVSGRYEGKLRLCARCRVQKLRDDDFGAVDNTQIYLK